MDRFVIKKFKECNIDDQFFDSLKADYPNFVQWFNNHPERNVYINESNGNINAILILKDNENEPITLTCGSLPAEPRIKICTLKLNESIRNRRLGEGAVGIALWHWQQRAENDIYVTVFPKQKKLISLLEKFGFKKTGEMVNGENVYIKSKINLDMSNPFLAFPYVSSNFQRAGILPIEDSYHDALFPYSEINGTLQFDSDLAVSNGITKMYIATPYKEVSYVKGEPILIYRKHTGTNRGFKSVITSFCTITDIIKIKTTGKQIVSIDDFIKIIKNKSAYDENELKTIYNKNSNVIIFEMVYNGYFGPGKNINWVYLENNGYISGHFYQMILSKKQFIELLQMGDKNAKNIIIN